MTNLRTEIEKILYSVHPKHKSGNCLRFKGATAQLEALIQEYVEGLVPPNDAYRLNSFAHKLYAPSEDYAEGFKTGYQKCRQDILTKIKESK